MSKKTIIIIAVVVALLSGAIIFLSLSNKKSPQGEEIKFNENQSEADNIQNTYTLTPSEEDEKNNIFADSQYGFSFQYPKSFTATKFSDQEQTATILVQGKNPSAVSGQAGFQVFIAPFDDEPGLPTKERILQDVPEMKITSFENRVLKNGVPAIIFFNEGTSSLGKTREIWFIKNGYLYQVSTTAALDSLVAQIIATWRFE
jgi:hypothetical protein